MTQIPLSRRAVTRALATLPIIAVPVIGRAGAAHTGDNTMNMMSTIAPSPDRTAWDAAMQKYLLLKSEEDEFDAHHWTPLYAIEKQCFGEPTGRGRNGNGWRLNESAEHSVWKAATNYDAIMERSAELGDAVHDAKWDLLEIPAPDLAALRFKLEDIMNEEEGVQLYRDEYMAIVIADYRRLLPGAA
jgi:hypothetical protein